MPAPLMNVIPPENARTPLLIATTITPAPMMPVTRLQDALMNQQIAMMAMFVPMTAATPQPEIASTILLPVMTLTTVPIISATQPPGAFSPRLIAMITIPAPMISAPGVYADTRL